MTESTFTPESPALATLPDMRGALWQFAYWGSGFVYIREALDADEIIPIGDKASRDDWPFLIDLNSHGMKPGDVTGEWLSERAVEWVSDRDEDIRSGSIN